MSARLAVYAPFQCDPDRLSQVVKTVKAECRELDLEFRGPYGRDDNRICVFYEDEESKCYVYIDDYEDTLNAEKAAMTIRVMACMTRLRKATIPVSA